MKKLLISTLVPILFLCGCSNRLYMKKDGIYYKNCNIAELVPYSGEGIISLDKVEHVNKNLLKVTRQFVAVEDVEDAHLTLDVRHKAKCDRVIIPAITYNGNHWGRGREPKGFQTDGEWHTYSYRRTPIPGATYSESESYAVAVWSDVPQSEQEAFSCALMPEGKMTTHSLMMPEEERPFTYVTKDGYAAATLRTLALRKGETRTLTAYVYVTDKEGVENPMSLFLDEAWKQAKKDYAEVITTDKVWEYGVKYAKESLWAEERGFKGFNIGLVPDGKGGWRQRPFYKYEVGWCGQNASFINSLLFDYLRTGDVTSKDKALAALECWTAPETQRENGFYVTHYDNILSKSQNLGSDACNLGTAAYNFFETIELLEKCNITEPVARVREVALGICDFVRADQQPSGVYGKGWRENGECLYREGTVGAFMIAPMLSAYKHTDKEEYFASAKAAYDYYYKEFDENGYTTAGALDTWCIDKESSLPLLRASLMMYDATGDKKYIDHAEAISYYLSSWMWHYESLYPKDVEVARHNYTTFGATSVSVQHHHLDEYALLWVGEWLRLAELTGRKVWREKALAVWTNGCQLISDGKLEIRGLVRPVGAQNEAFFNCRWQFDEQKDATRINNWLVAWPGAFRLETLRKLDDWTLLDEK